MNLFKKSLLIGLLCLGTASQACIVIEDLGKVCPGETVYHGGIGQGELKGVNVYKGTAMVVPTGGSKIYEIAIPELGLPFAQFMGMNLNDKVHTATIGEGIIKGFNSFKGIVTVLSTVNRRLYEVRACDLGLENACIIYQQVR